jgi:hypothetical protein
VHRKSHEGFAQLCAIVAGLAAIAVLATSGAAAAPRVSIICNDRNLKPIVRTAPVNCTILPPRASFAEGANFAGLKWRNWGAASAVGTGYTLGFHLPYAHIPVAVVAFRIVRCPDGTRLYSRVRAVSSYGGGGALHTQGCA